MMKDFGTSFLLIVLALFPFSREVSAQAGHWAPVSNFLWGTVGVGGMTPGLGRYAGASYAHEIGLMVTLNQIVSGSFLEGFGDDKPGESLKQTQILAGFRHPGSVGYVSVAFGLANISGMQAVQVNSNWESKPVRAISKALEIRGMPGGPIVGMGFILNFQLDEEYPSGGLMLLTFELGRLRNSYARR